MNEIIYLGDKMVGEIIENVYISHRISKYHFYIKGRGYPISNSILHKLKDKNISTIRIVEQGLKIRVFECPLSKYLDAVLIQEPNFDQQRCVPLSEMKLIQ